MVVYVVAGGGCCVDNREKLGQDNDMISKRNDGELEKEVDGSERRNLLIHRPSLMEQEDVHNHCLSIA